jgi:hypothetical protein
LWKNSNIRWRFWVSILVQIDRPRYVKTARRYSDGIEFNGLESQNRLIDGKNSCKLPFGTPPWNPGYSIHLLSSLDSTDSGVNT